MSPEVFKQQRELVIALLATHGRGLVDHVMKACLFEVPFKLLGGIASIITKLMKIDENVGGGRSDEVLGGVRIEEMLGGVRRSDEVLGGVRSKEVLEDVRRSEEE